MYVLLDKAELPSLYNSCRMAPIGPDISPQRHCRWPWMCPILPLRHAVDSLGWAQFRNTADGLSDSLVGPALLLGEPGTATEICCRQPWLGPIHLLRDAIVTKAVGGLLYKALIWSLDGQYWAQAKASLGSYLHSRWAHARASLGSSLPSRWPMQ